MLGAVLAAVAAVIVVVKVGEVEKAERALPSGTLFAERFDGPRSLERWQRVVGARASSGPPSSASWEAGSLRLAGGRGTGSWLALTREVSVSGAKWIRLEGRIRVEGVDGSRARYRNCNLYLKYPGGLAATRVLSGTRPWTRVRRRLALPSGTSRVTLGLFLSMPGRAWFDDIRLEAVAPPRWSKRTAGRYEYWTLPGDAIGPRAQAFNEESYRLVRRFLGVGGPERVTYRKYPTVAIKEELSGRGGNAHRVGHTIHTIWATDRHEIVHVLADRWGDPPALLAEGLAVHLSGGWQGRPVREFARSLVRAGRWIPPSKILSTRAFRSRPDQRTYAVAGAFVEWVLTTGGKKTLRALYRALRNGASADANHRILERVLGRAAPEVDTAVRAWVARAPR